MTTKQLVAYGFLLVAVLFSACTYQLNQIPITEKTALNFYKTQTEINEAATAAYGMLQIKSLYGGYMPALGEIPSDNTYDEVPANDAGIYGELDEFTTITGNAIVEDTWSGSYKAIQTANTVLARIDDVSFTAEKRKMSIKGEMKFIRALLYFNMVRLWGDVPLVTKETVSPNNYFGQGRTPKSEVYEQIKKDLTEAISELPAKQTNQGRVIKTAAQSLLAKVYITLGDYSAAKLLLDAVINSGSHSLQPNIVTLFDLDNEGNNEMIFSVQFASGINGDVEGHSMYVTFSPSGTVNEAKGHNLPTKELYNLYTSSDARKDVYVTLRGSNQVPFTNKIKKHTTRSSDGGSNAVVLRYADVLLMAAEVENELGNLSVATNYLNMIRTRANLANTGATTKEALKDSIALERRLELIGEGHRWFDLLRSGKAVETMNAFFKAQAKNIIIDEHHLVLPIPKSQTDTDPALKQNNGY